MSVRNRGSPPHRLKPKKTIDAHQVTAVVACVRDAGRLTGDAVSRGHFALETNAAEIASYIRDFMPRALDVRR